MSAPDRPPRDLIDHDGPPVSRRRQLLEICVAVAVGICVAAAVIAVAWYLATRLILPAPADEPAESPAATAVEIPTSALVVHGRSARVMTS